MIPIIQYTASFSDPLRLDDKTVRRNIEDGLDDFVCSYIALPPGIGTNFPQMPGQTKDGLAQLQVSTEFLQMKAEFNVDHWDKREACFRYAFEKIEKTEQLLRNLTTIKFSGVLVSYIQELKQDPIETINRDSVKLPSGYDFYGFSKTFSYVHAEKYFVNFNMSASAYPMGGQKVNVTVDINNRYGSDIKKTASEENDIRTIKSLHESITEDVLEMLIQKGELSYHDRQ